MPSTAATVSYTHLLFGIASATCVIVGNAVGSGRREFAKQCANTLLMLSIAIGIVMAGVLVLIARPVLGLYALTPQTQQITLAMLYITAALMPLDSISHIGIVGVLRGGGDTRFAAWTDVLSLWLIAVPLGAVAGLVLHWAVPVSFLCLRADTFLKSTMCYIRIRRGDVYKRQLCWRSTQRSAISRQI